MGAGERRVKFRGRVVMVAVENMGRDDEQAQIKIHRFYGAAFANEGGKGVIVGEARANIFAGIAVVGDPFERRAGVGDGFCQGWLAHGPQGRIEMITSRETTAFDLANRPPRPLAYSLKNRCNPRAFES